MHTHLVLLDDAPHEEDHIHGPVPVQEVHQHTDHAVCVVERRGGGTEREQTRATAVVLAN